MNTVWLLGAGFSKGAGFPIVSDFLNPSFFIHWFVREQVRTGVSGLARRIMPEVERWARQDTDLNRLMATLLDRGEREGSRELNHFVLKTLEMVSGYHADVFRLPYVEAFVQQIGATDAAIISFNYDTLVEEKYCASLLEEAMRQSPKLRVSAPYSLGLDPDAFLHYPEDNFLEHGSGYLPISLPPSGGTPLLKIHGSTCVWICRQCGRPMYRLPIPVLDHTAPSICPGCGPGTEHDLLFVPPASDRSFEGWKILEPLWMQAEELLLSAEHLVVVGYSLPLEDQTAREMLAHAAAENSRLRVLVVDPYPSDAMRERVRAVLPKTVFLKASAAELMGLLAGLRTSRRDAVRQALEPDVGDLLAALVSSECERPGGALPGFIPLDRNLLGLLDPTETPAALHYAALNLLGLSADPGVRDGVRWLAVSDTHPPLTRALATLALSSVPGPETLEFLTHLLMDVQPFTYESVMSRLKLPRTVSSYARAGIQDIAFRMPELDYGPARAVMAHLLKEGVLQDHEAIEFIATSTALRDVKVLCNRYDSRSSFLDTAESAAPPRYALRATKQRVSLEEIEAMLKEKNIYDRHLNAEGTGVPHEYSAPFVQGKWVVVDRAAGLMWVLGLDPHEFPLCGFTGLSEAMGYFVYGEYAGFSDWRLPTLEEAMALLHPPGDTGWCEDPIFLHRVDRIWTSDATLEGACLIVDVCRGFCQPIWMIESQDAWMRPVRTL